jgi:dCTP deaminase
MTVLPDFMLRKFIASGGLTTKFGTNPQAAVNPASIDIHLAPHLLIESLQNTGFVEYPFGKHTQDNPFTLRPGNFVLAATAERINLPDDIAGQVQLKSSVARLGLEHLMAGWIDPGFHGSITLELHNSRQLAPVLLWPGMPIAQLVLQQMAAPCEKSYKVTGRYNGQVHPTESKGVSTEAAQ